MFRNITQYFQAMLKNIINSHCSFNIKETQVCALADLLKCGRPSAHIFRICSVQNCLSQVNISETVYWVLKLSVLKRKGKRLFIHSCDR